MAAPSRRFFDLDGAAKLSRRILRPSELPSVPRPDPAGGPAPAAVAPPAPALEPFSRPEVAYKLELLDALLAWVRQGLNAEGCFALDERGFLVASSGELGQVPPEVLLSAFVASGEAILDHAGAEHRLCRLELELTSGTQVALLHLVLDGAQVILGIVAGRAPGPAELQTIQQTIDDELERFAGEVAQRVRAGA